MEEHHIRCRISVTDTINFTLSRIFTEAEEGAYGILCRERSQRNREEMEHVRERLMMIYQSLLEKRRKKILFLCWTRKIEVNNGLLKGFKTRHHHDNELFSGKDLRAAEEPVLMDNSLAKENRQQDVSLGVEGALTEEGRVIGRFASADVLKLSRRSLSEEEINLLYGLNSNIQSKLYANPSTKLN